MMPSWRKPPSSTEGGCFLSGMPMVELLLLCAGGAGGGLYFWCARALFEQRINAKQRRNQTTPKDNNSNKTTPNEHLHTQTPNNPFPAPPSCAASQTSPSRTYSAASHPYASSSPPTPNPLHCEPQKQQSPSPPH